MCLLSPLKDRLHKKTVVRVRFTKEMGKEDLCGREIGGGGTIMVSDGFVWIFVRDSAMTSFTGPGNKKCMKEAVFSTV